MGVRLYLKPPNKDGTSLIYLRAKKGIKTFTKSLSITVKASDWNSRNYQVKGNALNSIVINRKLNKIIENMNLSWSSFENEIYSWDELCRNLGQGSPQKDVGSFLETVYKPRMKLVTYQSYKYSYGALLKVLGVKSITFKELNYNNIGKAVSIWKNEGKSPNTIDTYLKHIGVIINEAYDRGMITFRFEKKKKWRVKKNTGNIESAKTEELLNAINNVNDIYDFQTFAFWLLMFCMRGLYPTDIAKMHHYDLTLDDDIPYNIDISKNRYVKHKRSKTGEPMRILYSCKPTEEIMNSLQVSIAMTHLNRSKKFPDVYPKGDLHPLMFFDYPEELHKNVWDVYIKRSRKVVGLPFKTARKTFESFALKLGISQEIRYRLLGHQDRTIKRYYQNWEWDEMIDLVDEAHMQVLKELEAEKIWFQLRKRGKEIGLNEAVVNKGILIGNPRKKESWVL